MGQYRKKPVVIEAVQLLEGHGQEMEEFLTDTDPSAFNYEFSEGSPLPGGGYRLTGALIGTLEGVMRAEVGDWIIRGVQGEIYPCKPDIFEATYEPV